MKISFPLALALLISQATSVWSQSPADNSDGRRPNIVLIMADDMGYSDVGCYGGEIETPNIDHLAADGLRFSQFYNCSVCGTTRASLMTGLYHHQVGVRNWNGIRNDKCLNIGEALREAGYRTMMVGKWTDIQSPNFKGFDRSFGSLAHKGPTNYFKMNRTDDHFLDKEVYTLPEEGYFKTDSYTDYAVRFLRESAKGKQPFFLYVAYVAPHWPLHAKEQDIAKYRRKYRELGWDRCRALRYERQQQMELIGKSPPTPRDPVVPPWDQAEHLDWQAERMAVYAAQVDCLDQNIGRILGTMREIGCEENTIVMFLSDNGATERFPRTKADGTFFLDGKETTWRTDGTRTRPVVPGVMPGPADTFGGYGPEWAHVSNTPVRGYKRSSYEGGILTPLIVKWPGMIGPVGGITHQVGHVIDIMPTCLEIAGGSYPREYRGRKILPVEGESLVPVFHGKPHQRDSALFWEIDGHRAVRREEWKLIAQTNQNWELYNLQTDRAESIDLASQHPDLVAKMSALYREWSLRCNEGR